MTTLTDSQSASVTGLFLAGLLASLHCAGMCGPLACAACGIAKKHSPDDRRTFHRIAAYQLTRVGAYGLLGAIAAAIGSQPLAWLGLSGKPLVLWAAVLLIIGAVAVETLPALRRSRKRQNTIADASCKNLRPALTRGSWAVGLLTPLLPCGVLYSALAVAALSGSAALGFALMIAFGLGTIPLLAVAQVQWAKWNLALGTRTGRMLRIGLAVLFAAALAWRGGLFSTEAIAETPGHCPMCVDDTPAQGGRDAEP